MGAAAILEFYCGGRDDEGRMLEDILSWPDEELEAVHNFIQWLFPLPERSGANPGAPVLDEATIEAFHRSPELQGRLRQAFLRMMRFYGFVWRGGQVVPSEDFSQKAQNWLHPDNHNHLRLTRILRSLRILGLETEMQALFAALKEVYNGHSGSITSRTFDFWTRAADVSS